MELTKKCSCCNQVKPISDFPKQSRSKDGLDSNCKNCRNNKNKQYRDTHNQSFNAARHRYYLENKTKILSQKKLYSDSHKKQKASYDKVYRQEHKDRLREQKRVWARNSVEYKIRRNLRRRLHYALKGESKSLHTMDLLGCSIEFFKQYIALMFTDGMTWENYGE